MYLIKTPNPHFEGERAGIFFRQGQAKTDDIRLAKSFKGLGYNVLPLETEKNKVTKQEKPTKNTTKTKPKTRRTRKKRGD